MNQIARLQDREIAREKQPPDRSAKSDQSGKITTPKEGEKTKMSIFNRQYIYVIVYMSSAPGGFNIGHCIFQAKRLTITELNTYMGKINETAGGKANIINIIKIS